MTQIFGSPSTYEQGKGILFQSSESLHKLGKTPVLMADATVYNIIGNQFLDYLKQSKFDVKKTTFKGEASETEINRITSIGSEFDADFIIGLGGGKTLDSAKAIADNLGLPVAILPTLASTDAPCSRLSVIYTADGSFDKYRFYSKNPDLVLVDTQLVANAPVRLLASGIADALATNVEAQAVARADGQTMLGAKQTLVGNAIAEKCEETLFNYAVQALDAAKVHVVTDALNKVIEANTLMSGVGFESGGLAAAHAIHNGLTALNGPIHAKTHGEKVAFGTLTQLFLEGRSTAEINRYLDLDLALGLPTTFSDLDIPSVTDDDLHAVGEAATQPNDTMTEMPFEVTADDVVAAMKGADAYSRAYQGR
ncbi:iron-containing alcohol dehydrogenase [Secundilactobacillus kimchicus]|uniref:Glycerol dehydrogenase n=1 Tax=Secundilactobacillus kimchicus JCM 15530 TaxID=1302272 RepID=A0A0R1HQ48_9LACO|nr:glycerol dehydrogenase [Secundilactobacillus kimchicus]KRK48973.1 glycerol dehydrogenase [Secundilactobacillus kimchicus JCM 15530]MBT9671829.1 iron-containing alcohol dehydrogenase [Secundilactobacillus kimchicus]